MCYKYVKILDLSSSEEFLFLIFILVRSWLLADHLDLVFWRVMGTLGDVLWFISAHS